jgi:hypothetical protein
MDTYRKPSDSVYNEEREFKSPIKNLDNDDKYKWYKTWNDEILIEGNIYKVNNEFCVYAGNFQSKNDVPRVNCCYTLGDVMLVRHVRINERQELPPVERRRHYDDERPIDTLIKDTDNTLMILIKTALQFKNITRGDFKTFYPNVSDMNNLLRCIEKGDNLSWARFTDLVVKLGISYRLSIYSDDVKITEVS